MTNTEDNTTYKLRVVNKYKDGGNSESTRSGECTLLHGQALTILAEWMDSDPEGDATAPWCSPSVNRARAQLRDAVHMFLRAVSQFETDKENAPDQ